MFGLPVAAWARREVVVECRTAVQVGHLSMMMTRALRGDRLRRSAKPVFGDDHLDVVFGVVTTCGTIGTIAEIARRGRWMGSGTSTRIRCARSRRSRRCRSDLGAHHVGRVDVAVDVGFEHAVHGDDAETADDLRVVADLL